MKTINRKKKFLLLNPRIILKILYKTTIFPKKKKIFSEVAVIMRDDINRPSTVDCER